ncbi:MAG TPA: hypothetical protein PLW61_05280 [Caldisericia bacterium]|nr:hypothetical protein [Caldisericia bacterium]
MKKLYTCNTAGTYFYNGANRVVAYGDSVVLDSREALKYASSFTLATDWNLIFNDQTITNAGGTITRSKTFYKEELQEWDGRGNLEDVEAEGNVKVVGVTATVVGTMPAGAVTTLDVYDENGNVVENKYEVSAQLVNTSGSISFTSPFLNEGYEYKITVAVPQGNPNAYDLTVEVEEIFPAQIKSVGVTSNGIVSGVNTVTLTARDADGDPVVAGIFDCYIASNPAGAPAPATTINGIADGGAGDLIEFADDQYIQIFTTTAGTCQIAITPTDAGTPTVTVLTISGTPVDGDTIEFGDDTYEFDTDGSVTAGNIAIDISTATNENAVAVAVETAFNTNGAYNVTAVDTPGTASETVLTFAVGGASTGDTVTVGTEVYEFTTDGATPLTAPTNIRIDMTGAGGSFGAVVDASTTGQAFKFVFNANTAYAIEATGAGAVITMTSTDNYAGNNALATVATITAPSTGAFEDATFGGGAGASTAGVDALVTFTATTDFLTYNTLATTDTTDTGSYLAFADATFGGGAGASTPGVNPALFYYLAVKYDTGKMFISQRLPWQA